MKKKFHRLTKREQEKVEAEYHRMKPEDFDEAMSAATHTIRSKRLSFRFGMEGKSELKLFDDLHRQVQVKPIVTKFVEAVLQIEFPGSFIPGIYDDSVDADYLRSSFGRSQSVHEQHFT